jgi:RNA polymerase sigma-54 factor
MEQRLMQSPQMIQAMQILQLSALELEERIEHELTENPFLEVKEGEETPEDGEKTSEEVAALDNMLDELERYERDAPPRTRGPADDVDKKLEAMANTPAQYHSLGDALLEQIALLGLRRAPACDRRVPRVLARPARLPAGAARARGRVLPRPRDHRGRAAGRARRAARGHAPGARRRGPAPVPRAAARAPGLDTPLLRTLITEHLEDITTNRLPHVARVTGQSLDDIKQAIESIRALDPSPGRDYGESPAETIHPDVVVEEVDGKFEVRLTRQGVPELTVSPAYRELLRRAGTNSGEAVRKWIKQRLESARWFIEAVHQRQSTLMRIAKSVFDRQQGFLDKGVKAMVPLRMLEVADATGVHISTVSRAVAGKYAQTPHGILPLRFFFSGGTTKASGEQTSQASIKQRIKELVEKEDNQEPLSDDKLAELLKQRDGITIARRTITKYRKALGIASSNQRRVF